MDEEEKQDKFLLSDSWYKRLRHAQVLIPVFATSYFLIAVIWSLDYVKEVVATSTVTSAFVGVAVNIFEAIYDRSDAKYDGDMVWHDDGEGNILYELELTRDAGEFKEDKTIVFRVVRKTTEEQLLAEKTGILIEATERKEMFGRFKKPDPLNTTITEILTDMQGFNPETPEYERLLSRVERLNNLKTNNRRWRVSPDTLAVVGGNILGILIIVAYERGHVMTTRAKEYVLKP